MSVQTLFEALLIKEMSNESHTCEAYISGPYRLDLPSTKHKNSIQSPDIDELLSFFFGKAAALSHQVDEANSDTTVYVQNQIWFLNRCKTYVLRRSFTLAVVTFSTSKAYDNSG